MVLTRVEDRIRLVVASRAEGFAERERRPGSRRIPARPGPSLRAHGPDQDGAVGLRSSRAGRLVDRRLPLGKLRFSFNATRLPRRGIAHQLGTAVTTVTGFGSSRDEGWLPGRIFIPHTIHMGLDNYPVPCECGEHSYPPGIPRGLTHRETDSCPFKDDKFPIGMLGSCCWYRGKDAEYELRALGEQLLSEALYEDMSAERALVFARELATAADRLERQYAGKPEKPRGAVWNETWDPEKRAYVGGISSTFEEAIAAIRDAARWYEKVGRLGFGVHAWF